MRKKMSYILFSCLSKGDVPSFHLRRCGGTETRRPLRHGALLQGEAQHLRHHGRLSSDAFLCLHRRPRTRRPVVQVRVDTCLFIFKRLPTYQPEPLLAVFIFSVINPFSERSLHNQTIYMNMNLKNEFRDIQTLQINIVLHVSLCMLYCPWIMGETFSFDTCAVERNKNMKSVKIIKKYDCAQSPL